MSGIYQLVQLPHVIPSHDGLSPHVHGRHVPCLSAFSKSSRETFICTSSSEPNKHMHKHITSGSIHVLYTARDCKPHLLPPSLTRCADQATQQLLHVLQDGRVIPWDFTSVVGLQGRQSLQHEFHSRTGNKLTCNIRTVQNSTNKSVALQTLYHLWLTHLRCREIRRSSCRLNLENNRLQEKHTLLN